MYSLFRCFPYIPDIGYGEEFHDVRDGVSSLEQGIFKWLDIIKPSHLVYHCGDVCYLKPYVPSRFARQFGYDQLYVGNPNACLAFMGSLIDCTRAWRYFIVSCTETRLCMPIKTSNLLTTLGYYQWYKASNSNPSEFNIHSSGIKLIFKWGQSSIRGRGLGY